MDNKNINDGIFENNQFLKSDLISIFKNINEYNNFNFKRLNAIVDDSKDKISILHDINNEIIETENKINHFNKRKLDLRKKLNKTQKELKISLNKKNLNLYNTIKELKNNNSDKID